MNSPLAFAFTVDKAAKTVTITKAFQAHLPLVWDAFTKAELLDQWWAPKPWTSKTKVMNFEVGGRRFYAMVSPEGQEHWSVQKFTSITPKTNFQIFSAFTDKDENINAEMPSSNWDLKFSEQAAGTTTVTILVKHTELANLEKLLAMGFQGGFTMTLNYLEDLLATLSGK